jgi:hypothetical protein
VTKMKMIAARRGPSGEAEDVELMLATAQPSTTSGRRHASAVPYRRGRL